MIKRLLGLAPHPTPDGAYSPSNLSLLMATSSTTDYAPVTFPAPNQDKKRRILIICTEQSQLPMANGKRFSTGNHPVEMLVPMLHLRNAGFDFDIYTPTGLPVQLEMWAMPTKDRHVMALYDEYRERLAKPRSLVDFVASRFASDREYVAVYVPGGHGALLGLPNDPNVGAVLKWAFDSGLFTLAICHGPAALLAARPAHPTERFQYAGYKIAAFPDAVDRQTPLIGYMPGQLPWFFGEQLNQLGVTIINTKADTSCFVDRKLITGASPKAANAFGKLAATTLLAALAA